MNNDDDRPRRLWPTLNITLEREAGEAVEYAMIEAGALGTETEITDKELITITAYFSEQPDRERVTRELAEALRIYELPALSVREMQLREIEDQDWLGEWKKNWQPVEVGRFIIAPPWSDVRCTRDRIIIRIEPGMAFGTGTHETTRLCLKAMLRFFKGGSFLDVGTGTGILAIAAAKLFPEARVEACDTDAEAIAIAGENARLNEVPGRIDFRVGTVDDTGTASADFVCANLTADVITPLLPALIGATCGRLVLSGILESQLDSIIDRLQELGAPGNLVMMQDGEWVALVV